jgi:hypothetical protein
MSVTGMRSFGKVFGITLVLSTGLAISAWQLTAQTAAQEGGFIEGTVTSLNGPEAGVWVIAETLDLPTKFTKIVVTDDLGRYALPDLPPGNYQVWVRGDGLVDSSKVSAVPGRTLDLTAVVAPDPLAAAQYYPAAYWFSLMQVPGKDEFPGTGPSGNGISPNMQNQAQYLRLLKSDQCWSCHAMGNKATREIPEALGHFDSSVDAWERRVQSGQAGPNMIGTINNMGRQRTLAMLADWTDRIAAGAVPPAPNRPQGVERNIVLTEWDWADPRGYLHDEVSTDKRNPTVNAYGPLFGSMELSADYSPVLDPVRNTTSRVELQPRDPNTRPAAPQEVLEPSPYYGDEAIWTSRTSVHNPMFDQDGRLWLTFTLRPPETPAYCREGSDLPSAQLFPINNNNRQLAMYDPKTGQLTYVDTCFGTHHVIFGYDADNTAWTSGGGPVVGWLNTRKFLETGDAAASQGWTALILDTNGNGVRDEDYVEPNDPVDPTRDKRIEAGAYGVAASPDGSIWISFQGYPGGIVRLSPGSNPPYTTLAELYELPLKDAGNAGVSADTSESEIPVAARTSSVADPVEGFSPRGMDVDRNGVVWMPNASGHMASFDRRKCVGPLNGPNATGQQCPEGWTFYPEPLPQLGGVTDPGSAGVSYYTWVDQWNTFGLGENVPINTGNANGGFLALANGEWVRLEVPYPMGYFAKWLDGRIDDPNAGWKGRGIWATYGGRTPFHLETTGAGQPPKALHFQLRPDPLAR